MHAAGEGSIDPRALSAALLAALDARGAAVRTGAAVIGGAARRRADPRRHDRRRRGAAGAGGRPRDRRLVGRGRVAAAARPSPGAPGQGPDPRAANRRRRARPVGRIVASERVYLVPRSDRPPDRRRHGRGAGLRHHGHRRRGPRAPARGLPAAPRGRRDGAGRGDGGAAAGDPGQPPAASARAASTAWSWATGHYRNGILLAPLAAARVVEALAWPTALDSSGEGR